VHVEEGGLGPGFELLGAEGLPPAAKPLPRTSCQLPTVYQPLPDTQRDLPEPTDPYPGKPPMGPCDPYPTLRETYRGLATLTGRLPEHANPRLYSTHLASSLRTRQGASREARR
jgi:hypothetical protein